MRRDTRILCLIVSLALLLWGPAHVPSGCTAAAGDGAACAADCGCEHGADGAASCCCDHAPSPEPEPAPAPAPERLPDLLPGHAPRIAVPDILPPPPGPFGAPRARLAPARAHPRQAELQVFLI